VGTAWCTYAPLKFAALKVLEIVSGTVAVEGSSVVT
jgi:hypothetical protein